MMKVQRLFGNAYGPFTSHPRLGEPGRCYRPGEEILS
jgi:hypothetical protein